MSLPETWYDKAKEAASYIKGRLEARLTCRPEIAFIMGSGLGKAVGDLEDAVEISYGDIPYFPRTTVKGHEGKIRAGILENKPVLFLTGRFHYYEGYDIRQVVFPVWVLKHLDIKVLVVTNASGGINPGYSPGDIMFIKDHISFFSPSPLRGPNEDRLGKRFPDMNNAYDPGLRELASKTAEELGIKTWEGVYAYARGPMYETPAEIRALGLMGADAVGMSTVPEVIAAVHAGIKVLGISCIANKAAGLGTEPPEHEQVIKSIEMSASCLAAILREFVKKIPI